MIYSVSSYCICIATYPDEAHGSAKKLSARVNSHEYNNTFVAKSQYAVLKSITGQSRQDTNRCGNIPDSKVHGTNMGPTSVLSAPEGPHVSPMNLATGYSSRSCPLRFACYMVMVKPGKLSFLFSFRKVFVSLSNSKNNENDKNSYSWFCPKKRR